ncbi:MAG: EMC3/TMCO1 family protein [bacterium]
MFEFILDPIFSPLFSLKPALAVAIISFGITLFITFIYKYTTDQDLMKSLKKQLKDNQAEMKKHRDDPQKMMKIQKKAMQVNMQYMKHSMKSTLYTMIPIIIIFGYLNSHLAYLPITPNEPFDVYVEFEEEAQGTIELYNENLEFISNNVQDIQDGKASWTLRGPEGEYILEYEYEGNSYTQELLITDQRNYKPIPKPVKSDAIKTLNIGNEKVIAMNLFGWKLGWLGTYIIFSIIFSTIIRKLLKIA